MMNILLLAPGIHDYCVEYANALVSRANVTMVAPARLFGPYQPFVHSAVDLRLLDWPRHRSPANLLFLPRLIRMVERSPPSLVHVLSEGVVWLNLALPSFRKYGLVTTMHDVTYHPDDSWRQPRQIVDYFIERSNRVIVHGERLKIDAERRYPALVGRIDVLPHLQLRRYLNIARRYGLRRSDDPAIRILFFGRILGYKGLDFLIRSIPRVSSRFENVRVVIAGEGKRMHSYGKLILNDRFFDIRNRRIPDEETAQLFLDADIVVLPYLAASQSGVLTIANTFGKPLIVTDVGELGQTIEHERTGLVIPPRDEQALADAIIRLISDAPLRNRLGVASRDVAERSASPQVIAARAIEIYQRAAKGPR
jgi:glycosyltransferase involved in cell wall biosynthesis